MPRISPRGSRRGAREAGADAVSLLSPPFFPLDDDALDGHFTAVARAVPGFPVFLYNIPEYAGNDISPDLLLRVASRGGQRDRPEVQRRQPGHGCGSTGGSWDAGFSLFNGNDSLALAALHEGADGLVSGNASARPELLVALYAAVPRGQGRGCGSKAARAGRLHRGTGRKLRAFHLQGAAAPFGGCPWATCARR